MHSTYSRAYRPIKIASGMWSPKKNDGEKRGPIVLRFESFEVKSKFYVAMNDVNYPSYSCKFVSIRGLIFLISLTD